MNKYLIPLIITTGIGIYYFCNNRKNNNIKTLDIKDTKKDKTSKDIIKLKTILELEESNELKQIKDAFNAADTADEIIQLSTIF